MCEPKQVTDWQAHKRGQGGQEDARFARHVPRGVSGEKAGEAASTLCRPGLTHTRSEAHERIGSLGAGKAQPDISCFPHVSLFVAAICCPFFLPVARAKWSSAGNEMVFLRTAVWAPVETDSVFANVETTIQTDGERVNTPACC